MYQITTHGLHKWSQPLLLLDCQAEPANSEVGCGGWPEDIDDIPLEYMSKTWRIVIAAECSTITDWKKHSFPNLLFVDRPRRGQT